MRGHPEAEAAVLQGRFSNIGSPLCSLVQNFFGLTDAAETARRE